MCRGRWHVRLTERPPSTTGSVVCRIGDSSSAVERFTYDARWKYAADGLPFDHPGFAHTVLVDMRARLAPSERPRRIFEHRERDNDGPDDDIVDGERQAL